jgi:hypothetical protein
MKKKKTRPTMWKGDSFELWVMFSGDKIYEFLSSLPPELSEQLDYSVHSLHIFESYLLEQFTFETLTSPENHQLLEKMARYVGEVARRNLKNAQWDVILDKKMLYYGIPMIKAPFIGINGGFFPLTTITTALDRKVGDFIYSNIQRDIDRQKAAVL